MKTERYNFESIVKDKRLVLIIYDIIDNKRRAKIVKLLESYGARVQKSAFEVLVTEKQYNLVIESVNRIVSSEDNVRIYKLNSSNEVMLLGTSCSTYEEEVVII